MNTGIRLVVIACKLVKLGALLTLVHCVGPQVAEHIRASFALVVQRPSITLHAFVKKYLRPFHFSQHL